MDELKMIGKVLIKESELNTLNKYGINVSSKATIDEVLFLIDQFLNENISLSTEEYDEIDYIANNLMERKYYGSTHK